MFEVHLGEEGLKKTWQAEFPPSITCNCDGTADIAFVVMESYDSDKPNEKFVCDLHKNTPHEGCKFQGAAEKGYWPHDCVAVAVYFCRRCFQSLSKWNQG